MQNLGNGKLQYVSAIKSNAFVYRFTSWMLSKRVLRIANAVGYLLCVFALVGIWANILFLWLLPALVGFIWSIAAFVTLLGPRTVEYYGLPFWIIKQRVKSQGQQRIVSHARPQGQILYGLILGGIACVILLALYLMLNFIGVDSIASITVIGAAMSLLIGFAFVFFIRICARHLHLAFYPMRFFARSADEVLKRSGAPPVVLLRSFNDDGLEVPLF
jgi:hypothetical protein